MAKRAAWALALAATALVGCQSAREPTTPTGTTGTTETVVLPTPQPPPPVPGGCGVERWDVKTMRDAEAQHVSLVAQPRSMESLVEAPEPHEPKSRVGPVEFTDYSLTGVIEFVKTENDGDRHLVLVNGNGESMIVESPEPRCAQGSAVLTQIETVRAAVDAHFPRDVSNTSVPVTVTGIGFFDRVHGQTGVAPNGVELHPLLSIKFLTGTSLRAPHAPPLHLRESHVQD